jgi:hypothetical protein
MASLLDGSLECTEVPHRTLAKVLLPMLRLGRTEDALHCHRRGYPMIQRNPSFADRCAMHAAYLALSGNDARALRLIERHIADASDGTDPLREFDFYCHAWLAIDLISERKHKAKLRLPQMSEAIHGPDDYDLADLATVFEKRASDLARQYDKRNGNDWYSEIVRSMPGWKKFAARS